jgi:hypothetical protein
MVQQAGAAVETLTIGIPMRLQRRGGRKLIRTPKGAAVPKPKALPRRHVDQGARARAPVAPAVCRLLPLKCLAPNLVQAILDGQQTKGREYQPTAPTIVDRYAPTSGSLIGQLPAAVSSQQRTLSSSVGFGRWLPASKAPQPEPQR